MKAAWILALGAALWAPLFAEEAAMKKVVMIIAEKDFRDEELLEPKEILLKSGYSVKVASTSLDEATGMLGAKVKPDMLVKDIDVKDFDAVVFIGGGGAEQYWDDPLAHDIAREAVKQKKLLAAICIAPVTLARAGLLRDKNATVWAPDSGSLASAGANYTGESVEQDGKIITGSGPKAAKAFGNRIAEALK